MPSPFLKNLKASNTALLEKHQAVDISKQQPPFPIYCPFDGKKLEVKYSEAIGLYDVITGKPQIHFQAYLFCPDTKTLHVFFIYVWDQVSQKWIK